MGLTKPLIHEIAYKTWLINELGCNNMYVLEGTERALVIDAGMGYCNLRQIVEELTDKPYEVVITHAHPDHIGMMRQFDRIWINEKEITHAPPRKVDGADTQGGMDSILWLTRPDFDMKEFYMNNDQHLGNWEVWTPDESVICRGDIDTQICYIDEGSAFDLGGGRVVTAFNLPGHSPGHMYFIDSGSRIAFTGDCVNFNNGAGNCHAASTHIRYLQKLRSQYGVRFDRIFTGHQTYCGRLDVMSQDIEIIDNLIEVHRAFLRDEAEIICVPNHLRPWMPPRQKIAYAIGTRYYVEPSVPIRKWEEGEEEIIP